VILPLDASGNRRGCTRCQYVDSCMIRPATLANVVGGNGNTSCELTNISSNAARECTQPA